MKQSFFKNELVKNELLSSVNEFSYIDSQKIRKQFDSIFLKSYEVMDYEWENFKHPVQKIDDICWLNLLKAFFKLKVAGTDQVFLMFNKRNDSIIYSTQCEKLKEILDLAWYPSDDLYLIDFNMKWCLALTHHDFFLIVKL